MATAPGARGHTEMARSKVRKPSSTRATGTRVFAAVVDLEVIEGDGKRRWRTPRNSRWSGATFMKLGRAATINRNLGTYATRTQCSFLLDSLHQKALTEPTKTCGARENLEPGGNPSGRRRGKPFT
jgi:hypothetical protein